MRKKPDKEELRTALAGVIGVKPADLTDSAELGKTDGWDSLKHMEIVFFVQERYGVKPTADRVARMTRFSGILELIETGGDGAVRSDRLDRADFVDALKLLGLSAGDHIFVQSGVGAFGKVENPLETFTDAFFSVIGDQGTLAVPAFNFGVFKTGRFDAEKTASEVGVFSEYIRKRPGAFRSIHPPFHSVAALGRHAENLAGVTARSSFGRDSVFGRMYDLDFKICMFGSTLRDNTFFHYAEEQVGVPYRFYKPFTVRVTANGLREERVYNYFARRLEPGFHCDFHGVGERILGEAGGGKASVGTGWIYLVPARGLVDATAAHLVHDPTFLILEEDKWIVRELISKAR